MRLPRAFAAAMPERMRSWVGAVVDDQFKASATAQIYIRQACITEAISAFNAS
jgi:hypothetical protein